MNLLAFVLGWLLIVPVCWGLWALATLEVARRPDILTLVSALTLASAAALTAIVLVLALLVRAVAHPLRHQVCPECRSNVAATARRCRYCRSALGP